ncbi:hypothetical protein [Robbsia sp. KACC 23696]|uniref:hypothetical protein n=1 Tax=Robbsia sp. KACC 23696 TaxID=3149231 RepID=UPI00325B0BCE
MSDFEKIDYAGVVLICDAHGIDLPVDCIDATVEIANRAIAQLVTPILPDAQAVTDEDAAFEAWAKEWWFHNSNEECHATDVLTHAKDAWNARAALSAAAGDDVRYEAVGTVAAMPGTDGGFTMATFSGNAMPVGSIVYRKNAIAAASNGDGHE